MPLLPFVFESGLFSAALLYMQLQEVVPGLCPLIAMASYTALQWHTLAKVTEWLRCESPE